MATFIHKMAIFHKYNYNYNFLIKASTFLSITIPCLQDFLHRITMYRDVDPLLKSGWAHLYWSLLPGKNWKVQSTFNLNLAKKRDTPGPLGNYIPDACPRD